MTFCHLCAHISKSKHHELKQKIPSESNYIFSSLRRALLTFLCLKDSKQLEWIGNRQFCRFLLKKKKKLVSTE